MLTENSPIVLINFKEWRVFLKDILIVGGVELAIPIQATVIIFIFSLAPLTINAAGTGNIASDGPSYFFISFLYFFTFNTPNI